jgi:hypothetical protein
VNPLPLLLSPPTLALVAPEELIIVIASSGKVEMTPVVDPDLTVADDSVQVWKLGRG